MPIKKTKKADIQFGKKDILKDEDFDPKNVRHRISIMVPENVLMRFREKAQAKGLGYQTLINQVLRDAVYEDEDSNLTNRVERLEKIVLRSGRR